MNLKNSLKPIIAGLSVAFIISSTAFAATGGPGGSKPGGAPGSNSSSSASYTGATTFSSDITESGKTYTSSKGSQNALLVNGGNSTISNATVTKSGDSSDENSDFYGTNAGIIATKGTLNIDNSTITTNGSHANAVFSYGDGTINISNSIINTSNNNSGGIMVTGGGTLNATNLTVTTEGNSAAAIRSDRGGGTLNVNGGTYTSNGVGSPAIYSTADVNVENATLISTKSEGVVVEGKNSVSLVNTTLTDSNTQLNGQSTTYKNIFLYQSMSGDADTGTAEFSSKDSTITTNNGDVIYVTNTTAKVELENTKFITNSDGAFLRIEAAAWGSTGSNGGQVTLNATNQKIEGDIIVDSISTLNMTLSNSSSYIGTINGSNSAKSISLSLDSSSTLTLTGDTYLTSLTDELEDYSNINLNGHILYVGTKKITSTAYNGSLTEENATEEELVKIDTTEENETDESNINTAAVVIGVILGIGVLTTIVGIIITNNKKKENLE